MKIRAQYTRASQPNILLDRRSGWPIKLADRRFSTARSSCYAAFARRKPI
jgi:hypothetical protein